MNVKHTVSTLFAVSVLMSPLLANADTPPVFTPEQQAQIGKIAADYLVAHPEVLVQVSQKLQEQQQAQQQQALVTNVLANQQALLADKNTPVVGPQDAKVAVIEFFDYQCVYCSHLAPELEAAMKHSPQVKYIFKDWPIFADRWVNSLKAAERGLAVWQQKGPKAYITYHNAIYHSGHFEGALTDNDIDTATKAAGAATDIHAKDAQGIFSASNDLAQKMGLTGTPGLIIMPVKGASTDNTTVLPGAVSAGEITAAIERASK